MTAKELYELHMEYSYTYHEYRRAVQFSDLLGKTIVDIFGASEGSEAIAIICADGSKYLMYHEQDCCESVDVNDICGDIACLLNTPLTKAEEVVESHHWEDEDEDDSYTWTFYHLGTVKGYVTIRWHGSSNGYYSESVSLAKIQ